MSNFSIICAIEAGKLECQTLLLLKSLRQFGGALAQANAVAFQGRDGPRLDPKTLKELDNLGVSYVRRPDLNKAPWFNFTNKIAAVRFADANFESDWSVWLDSDILVLSEPAFTRDPRLASSDFLARFDTMGLAVSETSQCKVPFWDLACRLCGVDFNAIPMRDLDFPAAHMKPYFNSGVMLWRTGTRFAADYETNYYRLLRSRIAPLNIGPWFADQIAITPTLYSSDLRWSMLDRRDNFMLFQGFLDHPDFTSRLRDAALVHYSKSRDPAFRDRFDALLENAAPAVAALAAKMDAYTPVRDTNPLRGAQRNLWRLRQKIFVATCREIKERQSG